MFAYRFLVFAAVWNLIHANRLIMINTGKEAKMISHFSHSLPGKSSMMVIRTFPRSSHDDGISSPSDVTNHQNIAVQSPAFSSSILRELHQAQSSQTGAAAPIHSEEQLAAVSPLGYLQLSSPYHQLPNNAVYSQSNLAINPNNHSQHNDMAHSGIYHNNYSQHDVMSNLAIDNSNHLAFSQQSESVPVNYHAEENTKYQEYDQLRHDHLSNGYTGNYANALAGVGHQHAVDQVPYPTETEETIPGPFAPRFQIGKWEISGEEARVDIEQQFKSSGLYPGFIPEIPEGLVNINYGLHACVHLGTGLQPNQTKSQPTRITFPAREGKYQTLVLFDAESGALHWLVVNIPGGRVSEGEVIAEYQPPSSRYSSGIHHYVAVALVQQEPILYGMSYYSSRLCDWTNREYFDLNSLMHQFKLDISAANFFLTYHDPRISEEICSYTYI